jgi:hypothetical protein
MNVFESPMYKATGFRMPLLPKIIMTTTAMIVGAAVIDRHVTPLAQRIERPRWNAKLVELEVSIPLWPILDEQLELIVVVVD